MSAPSSADDAASDVATASTTTSAAAEAGATVATARRIHLSEDWAATIVGLALVAIGLLSLLPEGLAA